MFRDEFENGNIQDWVWYSAVLRQQATGNRQQGEEIADNIRLLAI